MYGIIKYQNCKSNPEEKEQSRKSNPPRPQTILQIYSNQSDRHVDQWNRIGAQKETHTPTVHLNRGAENIQRGILSSATGVGKGQLHVNQFRMLSHHT